MTPQPKYKQISEHHCLAISDRIVAVILKVNDIYYVSPAQGEPISLELQSKDEVKSLCCILAKDTNVNVLDHTIIDGYSFQVVQYNDDPLSYLVEYDEHGTATYKESFKTLEKAKRVFGQIKAVSR